LQTADCRLATGDWQLKMARIISSLILIPLVILAVIYATPAYFLLGIGLIGSFCLYEYFGLVRALGIKIQPVFGFVAFWALLIAFRGRQFPALILMALVLLAGFLSVMWRHRKPVRERALSLMAEVLGVFYFVLFLSPAVPLRYDFGNKIGLHWTLFLLIVIWVGDIAALTIGKSLGKKPFAPVLSPNKTCEGALAGLLAGLGAAIAVQQFLFPDLPLLHVTIASVILGVFGQLGDLAESMLKRAAEIKDSSRLIPGHGGVLDRMDSLLFTIPVLYFYLLRLYQ
jgi:phosphatidate cytidylyltransferase